VGATANYSLTEDGKDQSGQYRVKGSFDGKFDQAEASGVQAQ
jgi:hypothetical protein